MKLEFRIRKSAGVPVTPEVHRLISQGNRARGGDWNAAAGYYAAALKIDPTLYHIWVQLGHARAEAGDFAAAGDAYRAAMPLRPASGEPWLHLGHVSKRAKDRLRAVRYYCAAAAREDVRAEASTEASRLLAAVTSPYPALISRIGELVRDDGSLVASTIGSPAALLDTAIAATQRTVSLSEGDQALLRKAQAVTRRLESGDGRGAASPKRPIVFDITDLVAHFRNHRLPTGIQRVQIEVIATALRGPDGHSVTICCFIDGRDYWIGIDTAQFLHLAYLASAGGANDDAAWQDARGDLFLRLAVGEHAVLPDQAVLVNLGTSWWIYDYYRMIRDAKDAKGLIYVPFVHDFIPIMAPEHCVRGVIEDYVSWVVGVFQHADFFLVNSQSTRRDLLRVAARLGHEVAEESIEVVPLDADFRKDTPTLPHGTLGKWGLSDTLYALFVSTIESRKNHVLAFETWAHLIRDHGADAVPQMVCVGRSGWLNDLAFERLDSHPGLRAKVTLIPQASDDELALLYSACRFTIYPSHYEGWGLPITESLCYGRVPVIADNSSLPEAGAGLAEVFQSGSAEDFARAVEAVAFDDTRRERMEARIRDEFAPRSWRAIADQINTAIARVADRAGGARTVDQHVMPGEWYPTRLYRDTSLWHGLASGEIFRIGDGWLWPETHGCRTRPEGGTFRLQPPSPGRYRVYLRLAGLARTATRFGVSANGREIASGVLAAGDVRWALAEIDCDTDGPIALHLQGSGSEEIEMNTGGTIKTQVASIALVGFALCAHDDTAQRAALTEAIAYGDPDTMNAYRRRAG